MYNNKQVSAILIKGINATKKQAKHLAEECEVSQAHFCMVKNGTAVGSEKILKKMVSVLPSVDVDELMMAAGYQTEPKINVKPKPTVADLEALGMKIIHSKRSGLNYGDATFIYNRDTKKVEISIDGEVMEIIFGKKTAKVSFSADNGRIYMIEDNETGYSLKQCNNSTRCYTTSRPLYIELTKKRIPIQEASHDILFDENIGVYYVQMEKES